MTLVGHLHEEIKVLEVMRTSPHYCSSCLSVTETVIQTQIMGDKTSSLRRVRKDLHNLEMSINTDRVAGLINHYSDNVVLSDENVWKFCPI